MHGIDLNKLPEEQSQPSSPVARDSTRPEGAYQPSSSEHRTIKDFTRPPGESSPGGGEHGSIHDFTRHFAQNPYYHQGEPQPSQEAHRHPEQPLPNEASCSQQQPQGDLYHLLAARFRVLAEDVEELGRSRSSAPSCTEHMARQPEEMLLSHDETATTSDSQGEPNQNGSHKRRRDEASSSRVQAALDSTISRDDLAPPQQAQSDQAGYEQQNKTIADQPYKKRESYCKKYYQAYKAKLADQGTTPWKMRYKRDKARLAEQGTTPCKMRYKRDKARLAEQGTTPHGVYKARLADQGTTPGKIQYARDKARLADQGTTPGKMRTMRKAKLEESSTNPNL